MHLYILYLFINNYVGENAFPMPPPCLPMACGFTLLHRRYIPDWSSSMNFRIWIIGTEMSRDAPVHSILSFIDNAHEKMPFLCPHPVSLWHGFMRSSSNRSSTADGMLPPEEIMSLVWENNPKGQGRESVLVSGSDEMRDKSFLVTFSMGFSVLIFSWIPRSHLTAEESQ